MNTAPPIRPRAATLLGAALFLQACSALAPSDAPLPQGAVEVAAPALYQDWALRTEACSGINGEFSTVKWYVVPRVETFSTSDGAKVGLWISSDQGDRIVIAGNYQNHEMVVSHEFLHHLLHKVGHPPEYFTNRCHLTWESWSTTQAGPIAGPGD